MTALGEKIANMSESEFDAFFKEEREKTTRMGRANVGRKRSEWCVCSDSGDSRASYYEHEDGRHGWFDDPDNGGCGGITQTG
jgi:hypothetical protein